MERWEKKSIPAVLEKGRPDAAYAIAMGLCEHLPLLIYRDDIRDYLNEYKLRIGKLIYASFAALVDSVAAWNNEEKREEVFTYIFTHLSRFDDFKRVQNNIHMLAPSKKITGEPVKIEREMNDEEERAAREAERRRREKELQILEAEKEAKSLIPLNKDYEQKIFNRKNVDWDCYRIWQLMLEENKNIRELVGHNLIKDYHVTVKRGDVILWLPDICKDSPFNKLMDEVYGALDESIRITVIYPNNGKKVSEFIKENMEEIKRMKLI